MFNATDYFEGIAYELMVLDIASPLVNGSGPRSSYDMRTKTHNLVIQDIVAGQSSEDLKRKLRPLFFGAAWKILDLAVEIGLNQGILPIATKVQKVQLANVPPISGDQEIWERLTKLYTTTVEARHCLVHRRFLVTVKGTMTCMSTKNGAALKDITSAEQHAFFRVSQKCAQAVKTGVLSNRNRIEILWSLDELHAHHGFSKACIGKPSDFPDLLITDAIRVASEWRIDLAAAKDTARQKFLGRTFCDIEMHFPETGIPPIIGRLEEAPAERQFVLDPSSPPQWAS